MHAILEKLIQKIPKEYILGPTFCIFVYVTSVEGFDIEIGFPVSKEFNIAEIKSRNLKPIEVLSLIHKGLSDTRKDSYKKLYSFTEKHGIISDEFGREIFQDNNNPEGNEIELQFIIHDWNGLFEKGIDQILGKEKKQIVIKDSEQITLDSPLENKFQRVKCAMERLDEITDEEQKYQIISGCSHIFPKTLINSIKEVYNESRIKTEDPLKAIDEVLEFMEKDHAWIKVPIRENNILYATKNPRDPKGVKEATTEAEKRTAYCFCPVIREMLDKGMPVHYCYCGAGWYRQQWEGVFEKPVNIEIVKSVLRGDEICQFAIHIPKDL